VIRIVLPRLLRVASFRLAAFYVAVFAGSALVLGLAVFFEARSALQQQMTARIETEVAFLRVEFQSEGLDHVIGMVRTRGQGASALDYLIEDQAGAHLVGEMPARRDLKPGWTTIEVPQATEDGGRPERVRALVSDLGGGVLLAVGSDFRQVDDLEEAIVTAFLWTIGLAAALGIVGGILLSRAFLGRIDAISRTAEAIIGGDLSRRVPTRGTGDDLDRLASTLNHMLDRIGILMDSLRQVSSDVAHDLRTPLSRLYQRLEGARVHARSMADYETAIEAAIGEAQGLLDVFSALLRIAQVEGSSSRAGFSDVDLSTLAETVADAYRLDAEEAGHALTTTICQGVNISADKELLTQALANLVENALRHTPPGTHINVRLEGRSETGVILSVEDDGPGVSKADLPHLTDRFYRGEPSRTTKGNGLGLSLVSAVAELHGATLKLCAMKPGLRVSLSFPAAEGSAHTNCPPSAQTMVRPRQPQILQEKDSMTKTFHVAVSKVPMVTLGFWIIKIVATTLGETGGDAITMTLGLGYLIGTAIFATLFVVLVAAQITAKRFYPFLYWAVIIATTTAGTTLADFCDRSLGIGYVGGSSILFGLLMATLGLWYWCLGSVEIDRITSPKVEMFYWATIMFSQTLGTALGDFLADTTGLGYQGGAFVFGAALAVVAAVYFCTRISRTVLFWAAFILTRPLGATVGDFLDKPLNHGGLALGRFEASAVLATVIIAGILLIPQRAGQHPSAYEGA
jgi:uncharacterized membrane-anchored protein/signal transduction histidine kinase